MDPKIKAFQEYLKTSPLGISYSGPIDGEMSAQLQLALKALELKLQALTNKPTIGKIISGGQIISNPATIQKAISLFSDKTKQIRTDTESKINETKDKTMQTVDKTKETLSKMSDAQILAFQKFFSQQNPIIGKLYSGPIDGVLNQQLIDAAKKTEEIMNGYVKKVSEKSSVLGKLFSDKTQNFLTSVDDLSSALSTIQKFIEKQK